MISDSHLSVPWVLNGLTHAHPSQKPVVQFSVVLVVDDSCHTCLQLRAERTKFLGCPSQPVEVFATFSVLGRWQGIISLVTVPDDLNVHHSDSCWRHGSMYILGTKISMNVIAGPSNHHHDRQSWSALQTVLPLNLVNQFPYLMNNRESNHQSGDFINKQDQWIGFVGKL